MALFFNSRYRFVFGLADEEGRDYLVDRQPFRYRDERDNRVHVVAEGDTLFNLAGRYFRGIDSERACGLWWVIADFNGIHDPTIALTPSTEIQIPSTRLVRMEIMNPSRRREI